MTKGLVILHTCNITLQVIFYNSFIDKNHSTLQRRGGFCLERHYVTTLLIDDYPLQVLPALAVAIGLNEAIVLQQIHYWLKEKRNMKNGKYWTYNSVANWQKTNFPFWSTDTIKRTLKKLEDMGLIESDKFNKEKYDQTKWYTINYDQLPGTLGQNAPISEGGMPQPIPETTTEINNKEKDKGTLSKDKLRIFSNTEITNHEEESTEAYKIYLKAYRDNLMRNHPHLKSAQREQILNLLDEYTSEFMLSLDQWEAIISRHFCTEYEGTDWNINHFASREIINNRYYETCY